MKTSPALIAATYDAIQIMTNNIVTPTGPNADHKKTLLKKLLAILVLVEAIESQLVQEQQKPNPIRPDIEKWLKTATPIQRIDVDEFIGVLNGHGDSGSLLNTLEACVKNTPSGIEYVREVLDWVRVE